MKRTREEFIKNIFDPEYKRWTTWKKKDLLEVYLFQYYLKYGHEPYEGFLDGK